MEEKKKSNIKKIILGSFLGILIGSIIGTTYAMFTYNSTSTNNKLIVGDIYMRYKETTGLTLENAMPSTTYDNTKYFEFDIIGKNTSERDIWYEIVLTDGDKPNNKNTKLNDKFLKFTLFKGNTMVVNGASYSDITNQRLYTETVNKNTNNETTTTYKLYMWIDNSVVIGNNNQDYTLAEWNDIWAAVKVNVNARTETNPSCFTISNKDDTNHTATISAYDATCGGTDIIIPKVIDGYTITEYGAGAFISKGLTNVIMQEGVVTIGQATFNLNQLTNVIIPDTVMSIGIAAFNGNCNDNKNCITNLKLGGNLTTIGQAAFAGNQLTSVVIPNNVTTIGDTAFQNNQLTSLTLGNNVTTIENYAFQNNQLTSLTLGNSVQTIGSAAFQYNQLTSLTLENSVQTIGTAAFSRNQLTSVAIPNSVITIENGAFSYNQLVNVTIGNGITSIGSGVFDKSTGTSISNGITYYNNPNLTSITINKACSDIKNNLLYYSKNYYPWLSSSSPYTGSYAAGTTIYGSNGEVCDAY